MHRVLLLSLLAAVVFAAYSDTLENPFVFDDRPNILENANIRLAALDIQSLVKAGFESPNGRRPLANISFGLNYFFHGYTVRGFHLVNILLHIITGLLLYLFLSTTLALPCLRNDYGNPQWMALAATAIWLIHPLNTQSVTYVVQRMNVMAALFYLLAMLLYARGRIAHGIKRTGLFGGGLIAFLLALGSKENASTLPIFLLLYEWYFFQNLETGWLRRRLPAMAAIILFILLLSYGFLGPNPLEQIAAGYQNRDFTLLQRLLTESRVIVFYVSLLLFPHPGRLNLDHAFPYSLSPLVPASTIYSLTLIAAIVLLATATARRDRLLSFCILWFMGNLLIESSVIGLEIVFEHRTYLPAMLFCLMIAILANRHIGGTKSKLLLLGTILTVSTFWTYERNNTWATELTLWSDSMEKSPSKARPHYNVGHILFTQGKLEAAAGRFQNALRINPADARTHSNLGATFHRLGRLFEAVFHYRESIRLRPNYAPVRFYLAGALQDMGKLNEAIIHLKEANRLQPGDMAIRKKLDAAINYEAALNRKRPTARDMEEK